MGYQMISIRLIEKRKLLVFIRQCKRSFGKPQSSTQTLHIWTCLPIYTQIATIAVMYKGSCTSKTKKLCSSFVRIIQFACKVAMY